MIHNFARDQLKPLALIPLLVCIGSAQEVKAPRIPNVHRIKRSWNAIVELTPQWNTNMAKAEMLLHARFDGQVLDLNEERRAALEEKRRQDCVGYYKAARDAAVKQVEALNELIEEEER